MSRLQTANVHTRKTLDASAKLKKSYFHRVTESVKIQDGNRICIPNAPYADGLPR